MYLRIRTTMSGNNNKHLNPRKHIRFIVASYDADSANHHTKAISADLSPSRSLSIGSQIIIENPRFEDNIKPSRTSCRLSPLTGQNLPIHAKSIDRSVSLFTRSCLLIEAIPPLCPFHSTITLPFSHPFLHPYTPVFSRPVTIEKRHTLRQTPTAYLHRFSPSTSPSHL